jgi:hypothetical protein
VDLRIALVRVQVSVAVAEVATPGAVEEIRPVARGVGQQRDEAVLRARGLAAAVQDAVVAGRSGGRKVIPPM